MKTQKTAALYARVSTSDGRQDPEMQLQELREYCQRRGFDIVAEYVDHMSGSRDDRPEFLKLMKAVRSGRVSVVVVWRFDRFARSTRMLIEALEEFRALRVDFTSITEQIDTSTPIGVAMFTIISALSALERSAIQSRVVAGLRKAKQDGVILGRPKVGFNETEAVRLRKEGLSWAELSSRLGVSVSTLRRSLPPLLKNPTT